MSKPVLAIDCDGVLLDTEWAWSEHYKRNLCGNNHGGTPPDDTWERWEKLCKPCFRQVLKRQDVLYAHKPRHALDHYLGQLAERADLCVVTSRPIEVVDVTANWLFWHGLLPYFKKGVFTTSKKREVCEELGATALLDDAPHNIEQLQGSPVVPVLWDAIYNQDVKAWRVHNWADATHFLLHVISESYGTLPVFGHF